MKEDRRQEPENDSLASFDASHSKSMVSGFTGDSHSIASNGYLSERQTDSKFQWKNKYQNNMFFLSLTLSWNCFMTCNMYDVSLPSKIPVNFLQIIVVYILFGCPLIFLQIFAGQFSRKGCLGLGNMLPIANGLGYLILINTFFSAILNVYVSSVLLYYFFLALFNYPVPAWMICLKAYYSATANCFGRAQIDLCEPCYSPKARIVGPCYKPEIHNLSSILFMETFTFKFEEQHPDSILSAPDKKLAIHLGIIVFALFITILRDVRDLDVPIKIWNVFTVISLTIMIAVISFTSLRFQGILFFFKISKWSFVDLKCWTEAIKKVLVYLNLSEAGHILFGSFTPVTINTSTRSSFLCLINFLVVFLFHMFLFVLTENFLCKVNADPKVLSKFSVGTYIVAIYPQALGTLASAPFWSSLYFLIAFGLAFQAIILQIITIEISLSQVVLKSSYRLYTRCLTLIALALSALLMITPQGGRAASAFHSNLNIIRVIIVLLYMVVVIAYGFQRLYDDIHFLLKNPPSFFYKCTWFLCLIFQVGAFLTYVIKGEIKQNEIVLYVIALSMCLSFLLGFVIKFIVYLRARDLSSLLSPTDVWGPTDQETRAVRRLFNPRFEVRFRRRVERCNYRCLLGSSSLKRTLERELALLSNVLLEMENDEEEYKLKRDLVEELRMHRVLASKFLAERATGEIAVILQKQ